MGEDTHWGAEEAVSSRDTRGWTSIHPRVFISLYNFNCRAFGRGSCLFTPVVLPFSPEALLCSERKSHVELYYGDELIWRNPTDLGHFGIKLRKQVYEQELADRIGQGGEPMTGNGVFVEVRSTFSPKNVALWYGGGTLTELLQHLRDCEAEHLDFGDVCVLTPEEVERLALTEYELDGIADVVVAAAHPKFWTLPAKHLRTYPKPAVEMAMRT